MTYSKSYLDIFSSARNALNEELENDYNFISMCMKNGKSPSWLYLSMVAEELTAYNELSDCCFFIKMKFFNPN